MIFKKRKETSCEKHEVIEIKAEPTPTFADDLRDMRAGFIICVVALLLALLIKMPHATSRKDSLNKVTHVKVVTNESKRQAIIKWQKIWSNKDIKKNTYNYRYVVKITSSKKGNLKALTKHNKCSKIVAKKGKKGKYYKIKLFTPYNHITVKNIKYGAKYTIKVSTYRVRDKKYGKNSKKRKFIIKDPAKKVITNIYNYAKGNLKIPSNYTEPFWEEKIINYEKKSKGFSFVDPNSFEQTIFATGYDIPVKAISGSKRAKTTTFKYKGIKVYDSVEKTGDIICYSYYFKYKRYVAQLIGIVYTSDNYKVRNELKSNIKLITKHIKRMA